MWGLFYCIVSIIQFKYLSVLLMENGWWWCQKEFLCDVLCHNIRKLCLVVSLHRIKSYYQTNIIKWNLVAFEGACLFTQNFILMSSGTNPFTEAISWIPYFHCKHIEKPLYFRSSRLKYLVKWDNKLQHFLSVEVYKFSDWSKQEDRYRLHAKKTELATLQQTDDTFWLFYEHLKTYQGKTKSATVSPFQYEWLKNQYPPPP